MRKLKVGDKVKIVSKSIGCSLKSAKLGMFTPTGIIVERLSHGYGYYFVVAYDGYDEMIRAKDGDYYLEKDLELLEDKELKKELDDLFEI